MKKVIVFGIVFLLVMLSFSSISGIQIDKNIVNPSYKGNTLYVGGSGEGNYTTIQSAINDASDGDTVFVYDDSSPYYEHIVIQKTLNLIGEGRDSTVIDGMGVGSTVTINANNVKLTGFTIQNSSKANTYGIRIIGGNENIITGNIITQNYHGIVVWPEDESESNGNIISDNIIFNNSVYLGTGISILKSYDNLVTHNTIRNNIFGIDLNRPGSNIITLNDITNNSRNIYLWASSDNEISKNNLNSHVKNVNSIYSYRTKYNNNYWGESRIIPKIFLGRGRLYLFSYQRTPREWEDVYLPFPTIHVDWNPAQEPYDI
jgi:parallel beta-helix repeat protein